MALLKVISQNKGKIYRNRIGILDQVELYHSYLLLPLKDIIKDFRKDPTLQKRFMENMSKRREMNNLDEKRILKDVIMPL